MATVTITITASNAVLSDYADKLGYFDTIVTGKDANLNDIVGPNPETRQQFLARRLKEVISETLGTYALQQLKHTKDLEYLSEADAIKQTIQGAMAITIS